MSTSKAGAPTLLMKVTDYTLDMSTDKVETTGLQDANKTYLMGLKDIKGTITAYWLADDDTLFAAADSADGMMLYLYPNLPSGYWWGGPAWLDVSIKVSVSDTVKVDGNFSANGPWTRSGAAAATAAATAAAAAARAPIASPIASSSS